MPRGRGRVLDGGSGGQDREMTVECKGWIIEYYIFTSPLTMETVGEAALSHGGTLL